MGNHPSFTEKTIIRIKPTQKFGRQMPTSDEVEISLSRKLRGHNDAKTPKSTPNTMAMPNAAATSCMVVGKPLEHDIYGRAILVPRCAEIALSSGRDVVVQLDQDRLVEAELLRHGVAFRLRGRQREKLVDGVRYPMGQEEDENEHDHDDDGRVEQTEEDVSDQLSLLPGKKPSVRSGDPPT